MKIRSPVLYRSFEETSTNFSNVVSPDGVQGVSSELHRESRLMIGMSKQKLQATTVLPSGSAPSDARLVEDARQGDHEAFGELVLRYEQRLIRVILRFIPDLETSRDLTQETFLRVYERLDQFDPSRRFGPWLFRVGVNLTLDYLRRRKRRGRWMLFSESSSDRPMEATTPDPREALDVKQEVRAALEQIPEKYRTVLILRDLENFSTSEIAAILDRKEVTIRWRLAEARNRFRTVWTRRLGNVDEPDSVESV